MSFLEKLEKASSDFAKVERWKGTFHDYLRLFETGEFPNMGELAHQRVFNMIADAGVQKSEHFGQKRMRYSFFEDSLYGLEHSVDEIMAYISSAAQRTETSRRMLLLWGPPSSGKSDLVQLLKRGLERWSQTNEGALFAISGSKMHENPFLLVPEHLRKEFSANYGVPIEGRLSPETAWQLEHVYKGDFMKYPVERIFLSEATRVGIGTWLPSDTKSQDISELVGGIDYAKIQEFGDEADPRAYNFDGELFVANRGIMEFIEGLKADEKFLRACLTATQEKAVKAPRFGLVYVDDFIIMHTNEEEFRSFMCEKKYEAYHDRMYIVRMPYNMSVSNEVAIYEKLLANTDATSSMSIAPRTLEAAAMFAVLSRLAEEEGDLSPIKKMKLYDGQHVHGFKQEQVPDIKKRHRDEGMNGVSPRFVIDQISAAISKSRENGRDYITALDLLRSLNTGVTNRDAFSEEQKTRFEQFIDDARREWNNLLRTDIQKAFFLEYGPEAKALCENYLDQIEAACADEKPRDPVTGEETELDEKLMDLIESQIGISESGRVDFRNEILRAFRNIEKRNRGKDPEDQIEFDYTQHSQLKEGIQKALFEERKGVIRMTVSARNPDPEGIKRLNDVVKRMCDQQGYSPGAANELLKYASAHLFDK